ncbi:hypothetical protein XELAEV_18013919mg [Xenopus laevis]|uniref:Ig-like domain-containing protein n=1 Tax=Xenopus laevis TaxID=8355 RepID=A0A974HZM2_XENLA|nr:hypothetical protein XELAEV_18013919mg [Xenopus laevis]
MPSKLSQPGQGILGAPPLFYLLLTHCCFVTYGRGSDWIITCVSRSSWPNFHVVYWLADNNFIEDLFPDGRVWEEPERQMSNQTIEKSLVFSSVEETDFSVQFCCIIQDPSGVEIRNITLQRDPPIVPAEATSREETSGAPMELPQ